MQVGGEGGRKGFDRVPEQPPSPSEKILAKLTKKILKTDKDFSKLESIAHTFKKVEPFSKDKWVRLKPAGTGSNFYYVNIKALHKSIGLEIASARFLKGTPMLEEEIIFKSLLTLSSLDHIDPQSDAYLLLKSLINESLTEFCKHQLLSSIAERIIEGQTQNKDLLITILKQTGSGDMQVLKDVGRKIDELLSARASIGQLQNLENVILQVEKFDPLFFHNSTSFLEALKRTPTAPEHVVEILQSRAPDRVTVANFEKALFDKDNTVVFDCSEYECKKHLKSLVNRALATSNSDYVYQLLNQWEALFAHFPSHVDFAYKALLEVSETTPIQERRDILQHTLFKQALWNLKPERFANIPEERWKAHIELLIASALNRFDRKKASQLLLNCEALAKSDPKYLAWAYERVVEMSQSAPDLVVRKGALHLICVKYQLILLQCYQDGNNTLFTQYLDEFRAMNISTSKLLKDYFVTTGSHLERKDRGALERWIIEDDLRLAIDAKDQNRARMLFKELSVAPEVTFDYLDEVVKQLKLDDLKAFVQVSKALCALFDGSEQRRTLDSLLQEAKTKGLNVTEVLNFALHRHNARGLPSNPLVEAARGVSRQEIERVAKPKAEALYRALINYDGREQHWILAEVANSPYADDFAYFLERVRREQRPLQQNAHRAEIVDRVIDIYLAMARLPIQQKKMSPMELVKAALVAEHEFRQGSAYLANATIEAEARLVYEPGMRPRIVDLANREITFLNKSKGAGRYDFGGFKKVGTTVAVRVVWEGSKLKFEAFTPREAMLRKDEIVSGVASWDDDVRFFSEFAGRTGLMGCRTRVNYRTKEGIARQAVILDNYDLGSFWNFVKVRPSIDKCIGYFGKVAAGIYNMHHYRRAAGEPEEPRVHGDIKPLNMLAASNGNAVLCDYGFTAPTTNPRELGVPFYGTPGYSDPEVTVAALRPPTVHGVNQQAVQKLGDQRPLDCFALGVSMYQVLKRDSPKSMKDQLGYYEEYRKNKQKNPITSEKAESVKTQLKKDHETAVAELRKISPPNAESTFEWIAWRLMDPNPAKRMTATQYKAAMQALQSSRYQEALAI